MKKKLHASPLLLAVGIVMYCGTTQKPCADQPVRMNPPVRLERVSSVSDAFLPVISEDASKVLFLSDSTDLVPIPVKPGVMNIYLKDVNSGAIELVSINAEGTAGGAGYSDDMSISSDNRFVLFVSEAPDHVAVDTNGESDVFLRDLSAGETMLISAKWSGTDSANGASRHARMSGDGRYIIFESEATDLLSEGAETGRSRVFLYHRETDELTLVEPPDSPNPFEGLPAESCFENHQSPSISANGLTALFGRGCFEPEHFYLLQVQNGAVQELKVDWSADEFAGDDRYLNPVISGDGSCVVFQLAYPYQDSPNESYPPGFYRYDLQDGQAQLIHSYLPGNFVEQDSNLYGLAINEDGSVVVFPELIQPTRARFGSLLVWRQSAPAAARALSFGFDPTVRVTAPVISRDGQSLAFLANADPSDMLSPTDNMSPFLYDFVAERVISLSPPALNSGSFEKNTAAVVFAADGSRLALMSRSGHWAGGDGNNAYDIFVYDRSQEALEIISSRHASLPSAPGDLARVSWEASPGRSYQLQRRFSLDQGEWLDHGPPVTAEGASAEFIDSGAIWNPQRFYRVKTQDP